MTNKLIKMSVTDIIDKYGNYITAEQIIYCLEDLNSFHKEFLNHEYEVTDKEVIDFVNRNIEYIDKEKLVYYIARNLKGLIAECAVNPREDSPNFIVAVKQYNNLYKECLDLLKDSKVEIGTIISRKGKFNLSNGDGSFIGELNGVELRSISGFEDMNDLILDNHKKQYKKTTAENKERMEKIKSDISLEELLSLQYLEDFDIYTLGYRGNADLIKYLIVANAQSIINNLNKREFDVEPSEDEKARMEFNNIVMQRKILFETIIEKFDLDKFLLLAAYRAGRMIRNEDYEFLDGFEEQKGVLATNIMQVANKYIENRKAKINNQLIRESRDKWKKITYSVSDLQKDIDRIIAGKYYSNSDIDRLKKGILEGEINLQQITSGKLFDLMNLKKKDTQKVIESNENNFRYMLDMGVLDDEEIINVLETLNKINYDAIDYLHKNHIIENKYIIDLYINGKISLDTVMNIDKVANLKEQLSVTNLMDNYFDKKDKPEQKEELKRYIKLFRKLSLNQDTKKDRKELKKIYEEIVERARSVSANKGDFTKELLDLYRYDLLPLERVIYENADKREGKRKKDNEYDIVYDLILTADLKPKDVKSLMRSGKLDLKQVKTAIEISNLTDEEKINFVFSSFENSKEHLDLLESVNIIRETREYSNINPSPVPNPDPNPDPNPNPKRKSNFLNPELRWQALCLLDPEVTTHTLNDGSTIFYCPNFAGGTVIIEKLIKRLKKGIALQEGCATYILNESEFYEKESELIVGQKVNRKILTDMLKNKDIREYHTLNWFARIMERGNIGIENGYTKEVIEMCNWYNDELNSRYIERSLELE